MASTLLTGLVAYWKLDESSGNAADSSGGGFTLTNNNTVGFAAGKINNGANFGASNSNKSLSTSNDLGIGGGSIAVSAWIKPDGSPSSDADPTAPGRFNIFSCNDTSAGISYMMHISNVSGTIKVMFSRWRNSVAIAIAEVTHTPSSSAFTNILGTYDGTNLRVYVNNGSPGSTTQTGGGSGGPEGTSIGGSMSGSYFSGMIDEVAVWNRDLTSDERAENYNGGSGKSWPFSVTVDQAMTATASLTAEVTKQLAKEIIATSSLTSSMVKQVSKSLISTATLTATLVKQVAKEMFATATMSADVTATKVYLVLLEATASVSATMGKVVGKVLEAATDITATMGRTIHTSMIIAATTDIAASISKQVSKSMTATTNITATLGKTIGKILTADMSLTGIMITTQAKVLVATASITAAMEVSRAVVMTATANVTGEMGKLVGKTLTATASILVKLIPSFWRIKYPSHGDAEDYNKKYDD